MKVNIEIIPSPMVTGFTMFQEFERQVILDKKVIFVDVYMRSKTIVSTSFQVGEANMRISWPVGNYNFHNKEVYNFADFEKVPVSYFKLSKKQGLEQYKEFEDEQSKKQEYDEINQIIIEFPKNILDTLLLLIYDILGKLGKKCIK